MGVPFIDIKRFEDGFLSKVEEKLSSLLKDAKFIGGDEVATLEKKLSEYNQLKYAVSCANGTDAIQLALRAVGVGKNSKVLVPNSTFWATYEAVVNVNADPYIVDTNLSDMQMDFHFFEKALKEIKPDAAIIVHLYGWGSTRLEDFRDLCKKSNIPLIEDGAQCFGVEYKQEPIYKNALISTTSFYPAKVLGGCGDGGAVFTQNDELADKVRKLANHGRTSHYMHGYVGWNSRLDTIQAAFLNLSLEYFSKRLDSRRFWAKKYQEELPKLGIKVIEPPSEYKENGYCNVTLYPEDLRPGLEQKLKESGIGFGTIYPGAMEDQEGAKPFTMGVIGERNASKLSKQVLNYPLFPYMTQKEFDEVLAVIKK
jgi:UDP-2-acetamido-2-deoxy-ribo-hexuluronate aminotransferase